MTDSAPWFPQRPSDGDARQFAPAVQRNRDAILHVLKAEIAPEATVLELASGSGEHALYFAEKMPGWQWQPSDSSGDALASINAWLDNGGRPRNLLEPIRIDIADGIWPDQRYDAIFVANLTHIAPFSVTEALLGQAGQHLASGGKILIYGPFFRSHTPPSEGDKSFDASLRRRDPALGIRQLEDIDRVARARGFDRMKTHAMPANNLTLIYRR